MSAPTSTIDERNDAIRRKVEEEIGDMPMGLNEDERDEWQAEADRLFFQFCEQEVTPVTIETLFTTWVNENSLKIKLLAHLETLTEAEKIALFNEVMR